MPVVATDVEVTDIVTVSAVRSVRVTETPALLLAGIVTGLVLQVALPVTAKVTMTSSVATVEQSELAQARNVISSLVQVNAVPSVVISIYSKLDGGVTPSHIPSKSALST